jgi:hypothetical protein
MPITLRSPISDTLVSAPRKLQAYTVDGMTVLAYSRKEAERIAK